MVRGDLNNKGHGVIRGSSCRWDALCPTGIFEPLIEPMSVR